MPRGYYLAQGLIPLGEHSSDDDEGPCELPDGRLVCGPHGLVVCGKCCMDFSFMQESDDEDEDEDDDAIDLDALKEVDATPQNNRPQPDGRSTISIPAAANIPGGMLNGLRKGTGRAFPTKFTPPSPNATPTELFRGRKRYMNVTRHTLPNDSATILIRTDGACLGNGQNNPRAGWAFYHGENLSGQPCVGSGRLEKRGPFGNAAPQTSNRAELRAVIAALRFRHWPGEGFNKIVIATDSEYIVNGATQHVKTWLQNEWKTSIGTEVKNQDLWEALLGEIEELAGYGTSIQLWRVPRAQNTTADAAAKAAAASDHVSERWVDLMGLSI